MVNRNWRMSRISWAGGLKRGLTWWLLGQQGWQSQPKGKHKHHTQHHTKKAGKRKEGCERGREERGERKWSSKHVLGYRWKSRDENPIFQLPSSCSSHICALLQVHRPLSYLLSSPRTPGWWHPHWMHRASLPTHYLIRTDGSFQRGSRRRRKSSCQCLWSVN